MNSSLRASDVSVKRIAIFGAGGGGTSAAAHLSTLGFDIRLYSQDLDALAPLQRISGIHYEAPFGSGFARLGLITHEAEAAMDGAELVMIVSPAHLHREMGIGGSSSSDAGPGPLCFARPHPTPCRRPAAPGRS